MLVLIQETGLLSIRTVVKEWKINDEFVEDCDEAVKLVHVMSLLLHSAQSTPDEEWSFSSLRTSELMEHLQQCNHLNVWVSRDPANVLSGVAIARVVVERLYEKIVDGNPLQYMELLTLRQCIEKMQEVSTLAIDWTERVIRGPLAKGDKVKVLKYEMTAVKCASIKQNMELFTSWCQHKVRNKSKNYFYFYENRMLHSTEMCKGACCCL